MFEIIDIHQFGDYMLKNLETQKTTSLIIQFFGVKPKVGDKILLFDQLLNHKYEGFTQPYSFEKTELNLEDLAKTTKEQDIAVLVSGDKKILLKRIFG